MEDHLSVVPFTNLYAPPRSQARTFAVNSGERPKCTLLVRTCVGYRHVGVLSSQKPRDSYGACVGEPERAGRLAFAAGRSFVNGMQQPITRQALAGAFAALAGDGQAAILSQARKLAVEPVCPQA